MNFLITLQKLTCAWLLVTLPCAVAIAAGLLVFRALTGYCACA